MKTLTIGNTALELNSFRKIRDKVVGVYAQIEIPTTAIPHDDLKALFTDNQHDLIVTEDESTTTYSGYAQLDEIREKGGVYTVIQICTSETMHLLNEARKQIEEQKKTITAQTEQVAFLEETSAMQMSTMDSLLLDVIPAVIEDAVKSAVAEAVVQRLEPLQKRYYELLENPEKLKAIYEKGDKKASEKANKMLKEVYTKIGLVVD